MSVPDGQPDNSGQVPAGLREALTEAARAALGRWTSGSDGEFYDAIVAEQEPALMSWLADHDAEMRQQGRNEAADDVDAYKIRLEAKLRQDDDLTNRTMGLIAREWLTAATDIANNGYSLNDTTVARGGSGLKGN